MNNSKFSKSFTAIAAIAGILAMTVPAASARTPEPPGLFSTVGETPPGKLPKEAIAGKSRKVKIDHNKLRRARFFVSLPDGVSYEAVRDLQQDRGKGRFAWVGHASDNPDNRVVIGVSGNAVAGTFAYHGKLFRLEPRADGSQVLSEVKSTDPAPELDPISVADKTSAAPNPTPDTTASAAGSGSVIDVLVAYTPAVRALYGTSGTEALILQAVAEANQAYANSGMTVRLNLVHSTLTNYVESGDMNSDLSRLRGTRDGYMDELHALRDQYGADVVSLIENEAQYCGLAYRMATLSASFAASAFSVIHHGCATGYYSFAHEIGHNQGAQHDYANSSGAPLFPYGYGYQDPNSAFRTIMAYNCPGGCTRISHFSNSNIRFNGIPTGYPYYTENAYAIDNTSAMVASFRQGARQDLPSAPSSLAASASGIDYIDLTWTDSASNETGFAIDRSEDGENFTQIASVSANSTSYRDQSLAAGSLYYYRVRAWNSVGSSAYSNVTTASTDTPPTYVDQYVSAELNAGGVVTGTLQDTAGDGGGSELIKEVTRFNPQWRRYSYLEHYWSIQVNPGEESITLYAGVDTSATAQSFTFAYSTVPVGLADDKSAWIDMFTVSSQTPKAMQFALPATVSGPIYISVRDNVRTLGVITDESIRINYLMIRTQM
ncbi:MAG: M12 family metallo-peptidase [Halioglobus sp.]